MFSEAKRNVKNWTKAEWNKSSQEWDSICADLAKLLEKQLSVNSQEVQNVIRRHHEWLKHFWTPNREFPFLYHITISFKVSAISI